MHFCNDELMMLMALMGSIPFLGPWLRSKLTKPHCCKPEHK